jgi:hypothetical protein
MAKYPKASVTVFFEHRKRTTNTLTDAATVSVVVKDPSDVIRVVYDSTKLVRESQGKYNYTAIVPDAVLPGEWYFEITSGLVDDIDVKRAFFTVEE